MPCEDRKITVEHSNPNTKMKTVFEYFATFKNARALTWSYDEMANNLRNFTTNVLSLEVRLD